MGCWRWVGLVGVLEVLLCACSATSGGGGTASDLLQPVTQASASVSPSGLGQAALAGREAAGFTVSSADESVGQVNVRVARERCRPVAYALSGTVISNPTSTVVRQASGEEAVVTVVLAEYEGEQAQSAMDSLAAVVGECVDGFTAAVDGEEQRFKKVALELAPEGADQAMGLGAVVERGGVKLPVKAVALRKGNTVAYLSAVPKGRAPKDFAVPTALVDAQLAKLS